MDNFEVANNVAEVLPEVNGAVGIEVPKFGAAAAKDAIKLGFLTGGASALGGLAVYGLVVAGAKLIKFVGGKIKKAKETKETETTVEG